MDNHALNTEFQLEHLMPIPLGQLFIFENQLKDAIEQLEGFKKEAEACGREDSVKQYQHHINIAKSNRDAIAEAIGLKEDEDINGAFFKN